MRLRALLFALVASLSVVTFASVASAQESGSEGAVEEQGDGPIADEGHSEGEDISHSAHECIEILEGGGEIDACQEAPNPILPETNEVLWGAFAFIVLFGLMAWKGYPAVKGAMDARANKIQDDLDQAEAARTEATTVLADYQRQVADARAESARIIEEARAQAEQVRRDLIAKAEAEANALRLRNAEQVAGERDRVMGEMQGQVAALAIELAEKVVESNLDRETNTRLIENYINSVGARS
jgi:F-type H+-transporting ATPase subunit b